MMVLLYGYRCHKWYLTWWLCFWHVLLFQGWTFGDSLSQERHSAYSWAQTSKYNWVLWGFPYEGVTWIHFYGMNCSPYKRNSKEFCFIPDSYNYFFSIPACSGNIKRQNEAMRLTLATFVGVVFGFSLGVSFPTLALTRVSRVYNFSFIFLNCSFIACQVRSDLANTWILSHVINC